MVARCFSATVFGVNASLITIEVSVVQGLGVTVGGVSESTLKESLQRIEAAIKHIGFQTSRQKVVINVTPDGVPTEGSAYNLAIALGIVIASQQIKLQKNIEEFLIIGELTPEGKLKPIRGVLPMAIEARRNKLKGIIVPLENVYEASIVNNIDVIGVESLQDAVEYLSGSKTLEPLVTDTREIFTYNSSQYDLDFSQVQGQEHIKRALEISAGGGHNAIIFGSSSADKLSVARRFSSILPPLSLPEALELTKIYSVMGKLGTKSSLLAHRPFKILYHTIPETNFLGGGTFLELGEIALGHTGTLFLEELSEFPLNYQEIIAEQLKYRKSTIRHGYTTQDLTISSIVIASLNSCPCGNLNDLEKKCACSQEEIKVYLKQISPTLLDNIDLHIVASSMNSTLRKNESSEDIRKRVIEARAIQTKRFETYPNIQCNAMIPTETLQEICQIDTIGKILITKSIERLGLSDKSYNHILRIARTIADLASSEDIRMEHIAEAIQFRNLERNNEM